MPLVFAHQGGYIPFGQLFLALHSTGCMQLENIFMVS